MPHFNTGPWTLSHNRTGIRHWITFEKASQKMIDAYEAIS